MAISSIGNCNDCGLNSLKELSRATSQEQQQIAQLRRRDAEVRSHEAAHLSAAGQYASGGPSFEYVTGPDGKRYAVAGEVKIDVAKVKGDPQETIEKARIIRRAALAPANPSAQDRAVAAQAAKMEIEAQIEMARTQSNEASQYNQHSSKNAVELEPVAIDLVI